MYLHNSDIIFSESHDCCNDKTANNPKCFTIPIPYRDRFYSWVNLTATCLNFVRSTPVCQRSVRQQLNELTAFIDGSTVYGSDEENASVLRTYNDGLLVSNTITNEPPTREQLNLRPNRQSARHDILEYKSKPELKNQSSTIALGWEFII